MAQILILDDESFVRSSIRDLLSKKRHMIREASSGREGLDLAKKYQFDLIITDMIMPGLSGLELVMRIRESCPLTKIAVITEHVPIGYPMGSLLKKLGVSIIFHKIVDASIFQTAISRLLTS